MKLFIFLLVIIGALLAVQESLHGAEHQEVPDTKNEVWDWIRGVGPHIIQNPYYQK